MKWFNQITSGNGGLNRKPQRFKDLGEYSIETLVRELIQNSLDAKLDDKPNVELNITVTALNDESLISLKQFIGEDQLKLFRESYSEAVQDVKAKMKDGISLLNNELRKEYILIIEENNTIGLTGSVLGVDDKSNFDSLLRKTDNNEAKEEIGITGGTWGKGSAIFTFTSKLWMWFAYSTLSKPWEDEENGLIHKRRFMGRCLIAPFYNKEKKYSYTGDGWFSEKKYGNEPYPFINEDADTLAHSLGVAKRMQNGTTFIIPFFNSYLDEPTEKSIAEEFYNRILQNWFIPIYDSLLKISIAADGQKYSLNKQSILSSSQLKYKTEILEWYRSGCPKKKNFYLEPLSLEAPSLFPGYINKHNQFAKKKQKILADLAIRIIDEEEDYKDEWNTVNKVFLTRNRGMLISYYAPFSTAEVRYECIFFGGILSDSEKDELKKKHLDLFLAYSENPAHNKWCDNSKDYNICFLDRFDTRSPKPETLISRVYIAIANCLKKFVIKEKKANSSKDICSIFKKLMKLRSVGDEPGGKILYFMRTPEGYTNPEIDSTGRFIYTYKFISNADEPIEILLKPYILSLEGEKDTDFDTLGIPEFQNIEILDLNGDVLQEGTSISISLSPNEEKIRKIRTCPIYTKKTFKNVQPLIKTKGLKITTNE